MFYSHEILTSQKHGVATVWIVATIGDKSSHRRVTRKAIQEVDVPKACDTIDNPPGAPIALRLQGSLLYGVSRVYSQQCQYVLGDAERVRLSMSSLFGLLKSDTLDPAAGKAKRNQLIVPDNPDFHIDNWKMPPFNIDDMINPVQLNNGQLMTSQYSQLSPMDRTPSGSSGSGNGPGIGNFSQSSFLGQDLHSPFAAGGSIHSARKDQMDPNPFDDNDELRFDDDLGLIVDAEGNIMEGPEPELPKLPDLGQDEVGPAEQTGTGGDGLQQQHNQPLPGIEGGLMLNLGEDPLPEADALPAVNRDAQDERQDEQPEDDAAAAAESRQRKKRTIGADDETKIGRPEYKEWSFSYVDRMARERAKAARRRQPVTQEQARQNAYHIVFGQGIGGVGALLGHAGFQHPLADFFAGEGLQRSLFRHIVSKRPHSSSPRGRRRSASDTLEEEDQGDGEDEEGRRVRPRLDEGEGGEILPRPQGGSGLGMAFDDAPPLPEAGREGPELPWHRHSSLVPGSSVKGSSAKQPGTGRLAGQQQVQSSPLQHRGSAIRDIERFSEIGGSDPMQPGGGLGSMDSSLGLGGSGGAGAGGDYSGSDGRLSSEGKSFLVFLQHEAMKNGEVRTDDDDDHGGSRGSPSRRKELLWVRFEDVIPPEPGTRAVAAQAFYQVLSLVTNRAVKVDQEGRDQNWPFGTIRIGVRVDDMEIDDDEGDEGRGLSDHRIILLKDVKEEEGDGVGDDEGDD